MRGLLWERMDTGMTEEKLLQIHEAHREIEEAAELLLERYNAIIKEYGFNEQGDSFGQKNAPNFHVFFSRYEDGILNYYRRETWSHGGEEEYYFDLPASYLTNNNWETTLRAKCQAKLNASSLSKRLTAEATEKQERATLAALQEKYKE
jgi:hypothetical protein